MVALFCQITPSPLFLSPFILSFILLVFLVLLLLLLLLGLLLLAEAYEVTFVIHGAGIVADRNDGRRPRDDEGLGRNLSRLQGLRRTVALSGAISEVPAVAVDASTYWGRKLSTTLSIYTGMNEKKRKCQILSNEQLDLFHHHYSHTFLQRIDRIHNLGS